jgi:hypothetical protein
LVGAAQSKKAPEEKTSPAVAQRDVRLSFIKIRPL